MTPRPPTSTLFPYTTLFRSTRNLYMLAHAEPETVRDWDRALDQELQSLDPRSRQAVALCGVPKPEMRSEEHTSELQSHSDLVCRLLLEKKKNHRTHPT